MNAKPYEKVGITPIKLECIDHIQKRLGNRLRNLCLAHKGTKTPLPGRGKLSASGDRMKGIIHLGSEKTQIYQNGFMNFLNLSSRNYQAMNYSQNAFMVRPRTATSY